MRLKLFLAFIFFLTIFSTTLFTLFSTIGETVLKYQLDLFLYNKLNVNYSIEEFHFSNRNLSFEIALGDSRIEADGNLSYENMHLEIRVSGDSIDLQWFKGFSESKIISIDGKMKLSLFKNRLFLNIFSKEEKLQLIRKWKFFDSKESIKIVTESFPIRFFRDFLSLKLFGEKIGISANFSGRDRLFAEDVKLDIDGFKSVGDMEYREGKLNFRGMSTDFEGDILINIREKEHIIRLKDIAIGRVIEKFSKYIPFRGEMDLEMKEVGGIFEFRGVTKELALEKNSYLDRVDEVFNLNLFSSSFQRGLFSGELTKNFIVVDAELERGSTILRLNGGSYTFATRNLYLPITVENGFIKVVSFQLEYPKNIIKAVAYPFSKDKVEEYILKNNGKHGEALSKLLHIFNKK